MSNNFLRTVQQRIRDNHQKIFFDFFTPKAQRVKRLYWKIQMKLKRSYYGDKA